MWCVIYVFMNRYAERLTLKHDLTIAHGRRPLGVPVAACEL